MACGCCSAGSCATSPVRAAHPAARHAQLERAPGLHADALPIAGPAPTWLLGSIPFIRRHGTAAFAHQAMSKEYGPVFVSYTGAQPLIVTVRSNVQRGPEGKASL